MATSFFGGDFFGGEFFNDGGVTPPVTPSLGAGGRIMRHHGEAYYPEKKKLDKRIAEVKTRIRRAETQEQKIYALAAVKEISHVTEQMRAIADRLVALQQELVLLEEMRLRLEQLEMEEVLEVYLISRMLH